MKPGDDESGRRSGQTRIAPWHASLITLFPEMFPGPLSVSIVGQALDAGIWSLATTAIRDFGIGRHRTVDDTPAGGGAGMIMRADVIASAIDAAREALPDGGQSSPLIYLSPRGEPLTQRTVAELAGGPGMTLLCGRFESVDQRVLDARNVREISIGDYVLSGGELAAFVLIDACVRQLPGVLGAAESLSDESFEHGLLEYPQYTRPRTFEDREIPDVLLSGDHARIEEWRRQQALELTRQRRPDLLEGKRVTGRKR